MNKRWVELLLVVAIATAVCLAQAGSTVSSKASASVNATNAMLSDRQEEKETSPSQGTAGSGTTLQQRYPRYQLCKGDIFDLTFPITPEFNQTVTVHPDGYITLTNVGDLYVAGRTVPELRELIRTAYGKVLHDPVINVVLKDFDKPYFIAGGEIGHPGRYELRSDMTLTQAIAIAGGFSESSKHSQVLLFRHVSNEWTEVKVLNVKKMFQERNLTEDLHLQSGDMFFVPQNRISKVRKWLPGTGVSTGFTPVF
jgi:polysaccharide biosynthesis/export protein